MENLWEDEKIKTVTATYAAKNASELWGRVEYAKETIVVEKHNKPTVVMVPPEQYFSTHQLILSNADRDTFLSLLDHPPKPNPALKRAIKTYKKKHK